MNYLHLNKHPEKTKTIARHLNNMILMILLIHFDIIRLSTNILKLCENKNFKIWIIWYGIIYKRVIST